MGHKTLTWTELPVLLGTGGGVTSDTVTLEPGWGSGEGRCLHDPNIPFSPHRPVMVPLLSNTLLIICTMHVMLLVIRRVFFFYKNIKNAFLFLKYYLALSISIINSVVVASVHSYSFFFFTHFYIQMRSFKGILIC